MPRLHRASPLRLALALALAPALAHADGDGDEALEVASHGGRCTRALVRGDDWTSRCAPLAVRARYRDGHQTVLFAIEGAAELSFHVFKEYRKAAGLHVLLVDQLRLKKVRHHAPGYCMVTGTFSHPTRLAFDRPVSFRCRAGTPEGGDLADVTFQAEPAAR
ncbi:MAG: hypothetical protein NDI82_09250 [Anaeromyxobacteraceae bacterium]|nr:hypothetical protein [Anaeromyxobacteraceae bacterium]